MANPLNPERLEVVILSVDIDWAPDFAIEALIRRLDRHQARATLFLTHQSSALAELDPRRYELGLHPHLPDRLDLASALSTLSPLAPQARGVRFHRLIQSTPLMAELGRAGFLYDASLLIPYQTHLRPFRFPPPLIRIPYAWEDDVHAMTNKPWTLESIDIEAPGLRIFDFHPIHVFLNTDSPSRYEAAKKEGFTLEACRRLQHSGPGTSTFLDDLLAYVHRRRVEMWTLLELAQAVSRGHVPEGCFSS